MQVHNPTSQSRLCPSLGRNIEPFEVADCDAKFELCEGCRCVLLDQPKAERPKTK